MVRHAPRRSSLDAALEGLLRHVGPVEPCFVAPASARGATLAAPLTVPNPVPPRPRARSDGFAVDAAAIVGASPHGPIALPGPSVWVEAGADLPAGTDAVLPPELVMAAGRLSQALGPVAPGEGARRTGEELAGGRVLRSPGERLRALDVSLAQAAGLDRIPVRRARVRLLSPLGPIAPDWVGAWIAAIVEARGGSVERVAVPDRSEAALAAALSEGGADLVVAVGGTGRGRGDLAPAALAAAGELIALGLGLRPGGSAGCGTIGGMPVILIPGRFEDAAAATLAVLGPVLDRLHAAVPEAPGARPLARKIVSTVGLAELALLAREDEAWRPVAVGDLTLDAFSQAQAWAIVPPDREGYPAGHVLPAFAL